MHGFSYEDALRRADTRAEVAEARVKELERKAEDSAGRIAEQAQFLVDAKARITQLDADLAAAKTVQVHALVADAFVALAEWVDKGASGSRLEQAYGAVRAAGIRLDVVRTLSKQEAEAKWYEIEARHERNPGFGWDSFREEIVNALMGMPVGCEFCTTGTRSLKAFAEYVRDVGIRGQDDTVMRQRACEALGQKWSMEFTPANPGADEAGGEGAASAYDEVMERVNAHQVANAPQEDAGFLIDDAALGAEGDSLVTLIRAVRLINAKVDTLARKA